MPGGEKGQGRPTEAARLEALRARWRSGFFSLSLLITGVLLWNGLWVSSKWVSAYWDWDMDLDWDWDWEAETGLSGSWLSMDL